ncbi:MAG: nucleoid-associated protein YgaU [Myxococcota bacterium]|jgi:nucleoid-associated protein YgaU
MAADPVILDLGDVEDDALAFDQQSRTSHSDQPVPMGGVPRALREAAELAGLDPIAQLYNEALSYAREGHLRLARERLQVLLCFAPDDAEARLLLARVHVAAQRWKEALTALDEARNHGQMVPQALRRAVEDHLRSELSAEEERHAALTARDQGELTELRQEVRRVRSENAMLNGRASDLESEARRWAWATAGVSGLTILFVLANLLFGGSPADTEGAALAGGDAPVAEAPADGEAAEAGAVADEAVPAGAALANKVAETLRDDARLEGTRLQVQVDGSKVGLRGEVDAFAQLKHAQQLAGQVDGVSAVDADRVAVIARSRGAKHTVSQGDTLSHIAKHFYGDSSLAPRVLAANKKVLRGDAKNLQIGQELVIPKVD